ncbi:LamG domain-containing protein [Pontibacter qinzhouensis]|uniref:LamG domain-containing protein n=1 Tax=Pontibacter qinzhouensis TaxID=2603253 RepID=A0A5C8IHE1_9BACT|nr:LamG-like jellyroll fold domain-containing protein [Pontibacter qinzhouensis]TXK21028.1 LamG domain-containing protein [Pontibacter qinzhouensis]
MMKHTHTLLWLLALLCLGCGTGKKAADARSPIEIWWLESLEAVGKHQATVLGEPTLISVARGEKAVEFDGKDDGLQLTANPIFGAEEFTIEMVFNPYDAFPANVEQRIFHIQDPVNLDRRILMELRLNDKKEWFADFFMKTESERLVLIDSTKTHPVNQWATMTLTYKDKKMTGYVNGVEEGSGTITFLPMSEQANVSLGTRINKVSWFKGAIKTVRFIPWALPPLEP